MNSPLLIEAKWKFRLAGQRGMNSNVWSDIDVAVISPDFSDDLFEERLKLMKMAAIIDDRIEPHPFRVEDFESSNPLASEIQKHGILIS